MDVLLESKGSPTVWLVPLRGCSASGRGSPAGTAVADGNICVSDGERVYVLCGLLCRHPPFDPCCLLPGITASASGRPDA